MRSFRFSPEQVLRVLKDLAATPTVFVEDPLAVVQALEWFTAGLDFADALHVASSGTAERFVTFDQDLIKQAKHRTTVQVTAA